MTLSFKEGMQQTELRLGQMAWNNIADVDESTLRAQAAIAAMQTLMGDKRYSYCDVAIDAVAYADALMAELAK